jgi:hypothetical protein
VDETVLDHRGLRVHAHDLVQLRLIARHGVQAVGDQFLDQLGGRSLVLDQHDTRAQPLVLRAHGALQLRVLHAPPQYIDQIEVFAVNSPGRAPLPFPPPHAREGWVGLSSVALLAVSQLCTMRSNFTGNSAAA